MMDARRLTLVTAAALTMGCSGPMLAEHRYLVDSRFTEDDVALLQVAADEWTAAIDYDDPIIVLEPGWDNGDFTFADWSRTDGTRELYRAYESDTGLTGMDAVEETRFFGACNVEDDIFIAGDRIATDSLFTAIAIHEFGHAFGVWHMDGGTMSGSGPETLPDPACIDQVTVDAFCSKHLCGADAAGTCR